MPRALLVALSVSLAAAPARAQLQELENPGSVSAIQDRPFRLLHELNLSVGVLPLDAFYKGIYGQVAYTVHFTDTFAWQVGRAAYSYSLRTGLREELERRFGVLPTAAEEVQFFFGSDLLWTPLFGKMAVLNRSVVFGELFLMLGATLFRFTNSFRPGVNLGIGGRVFVSRYVSFRLDIANNVIIPITGTIQLQNVMTTTLSLAVNFGGNEPRAEERP